MNNGTRLVQVVGSFTCTCLLALPAAAQSQAPAEETRASLPAEAATDSFGAIFEQTLGTIFQETISDFRRLPSLDTLSWLGAGAIAAGVVHPADRPTSQGLSSSARLDPVFEAGETVGGASFQILGAIGTLAVGKATGSQKVAAVGADLVKAQVIAQSVTAAIKMTARRTRPDGTRYSFPSGHTSVTFASATVLQRHLGWKTGMLGYGVATYVAASRIQEKRHFLSDVTFGAVIGIVAGRTVTIGRGEARFAVSPVAHPGGGAVSFNWIGQR